MLNNSGQEKFRLKAFNVIGKTEMSHEEATIFSMCDNFLGSKSERCLAALDDIVYNHSLDNIGM